MLVLFLFSSPICGGTPTFIIEPILFRCVETDIRAVTQHLAENAVCSVTCSRHCQRAEQFDAEPPCPIRFDCVFRHPLWSYCMGAGRPPPDAVQFPQRFHDRLTPRFRTEIASEQGYYNTFCMRLQAMGAKQYGYVRETLI